MAAATALLDRAIGRPKVEVGIDATVEHTEWVVRIPQEEASVEAWLARYAPPHVREQQRLEQEKQTIDGKVVDLRPDWTK